MSEEQKILPEGWKWVKLGDLCTRMSNGANVKQADDIIGLPITRIETIWNESIDLNRVKYIVEDSDQFIEKYGLLNNDILFSHINSDTHLGKTAIFKQQVKTLIHGINLLLIRLDKNVDADFINYQFKYKRKKGNFISIAQKSVNQSSINQAKLKNVEFILPPLTTQQAIVSKIEELFSELNNGIAQLKTAQQQLNTYRQSVLNSILSDENLKSINTIIEKLDQGWSPRCENTPSSKDEWGVIKTSAVQHGYFDESQNKKLPDNLVPRKQHELNKGDILITRAGPRVRVGVCCFIKTVRPKLINCDKVYRILVNRKEILPEYFVLVMNTPKYLGIIEEMKTGISDSGVNLTQTKFLTIEIPVPNLNNQQNIINEIESRLSVADKLQETIDAALAQSESLRQSILKQAFEGKLVN